MTRETTSIRAALLTGLKDIVPVLPSILPFGMITGAAAVGVGLSVPISLGMSVIIFAGASQLAVTQLLSTGATIVAILLTAGLINLRFVLYSASLAPHFQRLSLPWRILLAYLITDPGFAVTIARLNQSNDDEFKRWYTLSATGTVWLVWVIGTVLGVALGARIPASWSLDFVITMQFLAVLVPTIQDRATVASALTALGIAVAADGLPFQLGLMAGALSGILVGLVVESQPGADSPDSPDSPADPGGTADDA